MLSYMTVDMRTTRTAGPIYPGWQYGKGFDQQAAFEVEWGWLAFPIVVVVVSLVFLVTTIILNRQDEVWKSSVLAMMYHSFGDDDRKSLGDLDTLAAMEKLTRDQKVQLERQTNATSGQWMFRTKDGNHRRNDDNYAKVGDGVSKFFGHGFEVTHDVLN